MSRFAVLQTERETPGIEALERAFAQIPFLVRADAGIVAKDAFGILLKRLAFADARLVQARLAAEDVATEIVAEDAIPELPPTKFVKRIHLRDEGLEIFDPIGRNIVIGWPHIHLLAAGQVRTLASQARPARLVLQELRKGQLRRLEPRQGEPPAAGRWFIDLVIARGAGRFTLEPEPVLLGNALGRPPGRDLVPATRALLSAMAEKAPHLWLNGGASALLGSQTVDDYPSRNAYHEEIVWLLWQMGQSKG
jgi:hypothetical protein